MPGYEVIEHMDTIKPPSPVQKNSGSRLVMPSSPLARDTGGKVVHQQKLSPHPGGPPGFLAQPPGGKGKTQGKRKKAHRDRQKHLPKGSAWRWVLPRNGHEAIRKRHGTGSPSTRPRGEHGDELTSTRRRNIVRRATSYQILGRDITENGKEEEEREGKICKHPHLRSVSR